MVKGWVLPPPTRWEQALEVTFSGMREEGKQKAYISESKKQNCSFAGYLIPYSKYSVHPKGNQSWIFIGRTDAEAETPILWSPDVKNWLTRKELDAGKDWRQEEKGMTEDETVGWHHLLGGHEFEWTPGVCDGRGGLVCCNGVAKSWTQLSDWTELKEH